MMTSFSYYYRKSSLLPRLIFGLFYLIFVALWTKGAWSMVGLSPQNGSTSVDVFSRIRPMFLVIPIFMIGVGLYLVLPTLFKLLLPTAVISGDHQGLTVRGAWFKKEHFTWEEINYLRYEQRTHLYRNQQSATTRSYLQELLFIKPQSGRTVSVTISQLDGAIDDIIADIQTCAPNLEICGFEK